MDSDLEACRFSSARRTAIVEPGQLPDRIPFESVRFDLFVMTDVLEHLDRDQEALVALRDRLSRAVAAGDRPRVLLAVELA